MNTKGESKYSIEKIGAENVLRQRKQTDSRVKRQSLTMSTVSEVTTHLIIVRKAINIQVAFVV